MRILRVWVFLLVASVAGAAVASCAAKPVTVTRATLESASFTEPLVWRGESPSIVLAGHALDLRITIPEVDCGAEVSAPSVNLEFAEGSAAFEPQDPYKLIDRLHSTGCHEKNVAAVASFTAEKLVSPSAVASPADLVISIRLTGDDGVVVVESIHGTTLLSPSVDGIGVVERPLNQTVSSDGPREIHVLIVPNRCDAHALAEDQLGTRLSLTVVASNGTTGRITLVASDKLRKQMYSFYSSYCGL